MSDPAQPPSELDRLFAEARAQRADTSRAEFAFETRLLARMKQPPPALTSVWVRINWQLMPAFALAVIGLMIWEILISQAAVEAQQTALVENPEASELLANFN